MTQPTRPYIAQVPLLHGRVEVPVDGELMLTEEQAAALGDAVKAKPQEPAIQPGGGSDEA